MVALLNAQFRDQVITFLRAQFCNLVATFLNAQLRDQVTTLLRAQFCDLIAALLNAELSVLRCDRCVCRADNSNSRDCGQCGDGREFKKCLFEASYISR